MYASGDTCLPLPTGIPPETAPSPDGAPDASVASALDGSLAPPGRAVQDAIADFDVVCETGRPVAECVQYQALLTSCFRRAVDFACQDSLIPKTDADIAAIGQLCADDIMRLQTACR